MRKYVLVSLMILAMAGFAAAQLGSATTDELGAHLNYGRGCAGCHAPHSGAYGNGAAKTADPTSGNDILWGQDVGSLYNQYLIFAGNRGELLPPNMETGTPDVSGLITCLSCHDGNLAKGAMMQGTVYETLPGTYGKYNSVPTLLGNDGTTLGNYLNDHPVGMNATLSCGAPWNWDCTAAANGKILMTGPLSTLFVTNYGFFINQAVYGGKSYVMCTTCHNQHVMNEVSVNSTNSGQTAGYYKTMFFAIGPYNPASGTANSNQTAQFCRQCHGGNSNEMKGSTAGTTY